MLKFVGGGLRYFHTVNCIWTMSSATSCWSLMVDEVPGVNFHPDDWALPSRISEHSILSTELNADRNWHLPARRLVATWVSEILNFRSGNAIYLGNVSTSDWKIGLNVTRVQNLLVKRLSSKLTDTNTSRPEDSVLFAEEIFSSSGMRMPFCLRKFWLPASRLSST